MTAQFVVVPLELGHTAQERDTPHPQGFTHDWKAFIRGADGKDLQPFVEKVVFQLHETFEHPIQERSEPPYEIQESGYARFNLSLTMFFKNEEEPKRMMYDYNLYLPPLGMPPVRHARQEMLTFNRPPAAFLRKLMVSGGIITDDPSNIPDKFKKEKARSQRVANTPSYENYGSEAEETKRGDTSSSNGGTGGAGEKEESRKSKLKKKDKDREMGESSVKRSPAAVVAAPPDVSGSSSAPSDNVPRDYVPSAEKGREKEKKSSASSSSKKPFQPQQVLSGASSASSEARSDSKSKVKSKSHSGEKRKKKSSPEDSDTHMDISPRYPSHSSEQVVGLFGTPLHEPHPSLSPPSPWKSQGTSSTQELLQRQTSDEKSSRSSGSKSKKKKKKGTGNSGSDPSALSPLPFSATSHKDASGRGSSSSVTTGNTAPFSPSISEELSGSTSSAALAHASSERRKGKKLSSSADKESKKKSSVREEVPGTTVAPSNKESLYSGPEEVSSSKKKKKGGAAVTTAAVTTAAASSALSESDREFSRAEDKALAPPRRSVGATNSRDKNHVAPDSSSPEYQEYFNTVLLPLQSKLLSLTEQDGDVVESVMTLVENLSDSFEITDVAFNFDVCMLPPKVIGELRSLLGV